MHLSSGKGHMVLCMLPFGQFEHSVIHDPGHALSCAPDQAQHLVRQVPKLKHRGVSRCLAIDLFGPHRLDAEQNSYHTDPLPEDSNWADFDCWGRMDLSERL
jgi:hypothetical protein